MPKTSLDPYYLLRWDFSRDEVIDRDLVGAAHRLGELALASDRGLRELLGKIPAGAVSVHTMGENPAYRSEWQSGALGDVSVPDLIDLTGRGRLWVTISQIDGYDAKAAELAARLSRELQECHVGLRIIQPQLDLVLASPRAQYYYGCDAAPSVLFQLRGRMRLRVYPSDQRYIDAHQHQRIACLQRHQHLYYEPAFDRQSCAIDVKPGRLISWPQPHPYRIDCLEGLNLYLRLRFQTPRSLRQNNVHVVNRFLNPWMPGSCCEERISGLTASLKQCFAAFLPAAQLDSAQAEPTFALDAALPRGIRWLVRQADGNESASATIAATITGLNPAPTTAVVVEN